jgi:DNA-binding MarR family transcriptional regulator
MRAPGPNATRWRKLCLEALPSRPIWTLRELSELRIGLPPVGVHRAVLRLEEEGLVRVERPPDDAWKISLILPADLEAIARWIDAELEESSDDSSTGLVR